MARVRVTQPKKNTKADAIASRIITPAIRYSKPELQTHITYLYTMTNGPDQKSAAMPLSVTKCCAWNWIGSSPNWTSFINRFSY